MFSSGATSSARKNEKASRSHPSTNAGSSSQDLLERSDVDCWTCRRRHIKCDRIISPTGCNKCAKKPVQCLGYQKPLRWAEGVAVRGKLKGKSQPVVDGVLQITIAVGAISFANILNRRGRKHCSQYYEAAVHFFDSECRARCTSNLRGFSRRRA